MIKYANFIKMMAPGCFSKQPAKKYHGDAGWDLFVSRSCVIQPGQTADVHTDIRMNLPQGIFARIIGRSSTLRKHGLIVNEGIIDNGYNGELFLCIHNLHPSQPFHVHNGMRLAQILFHTIEDVRWAEVDESHFQDTNRGSAGFGSTGVYDVESLQRVEGWNHAD